MIIYVFHSHDSMGNIVFLFCIAGRMSEVECPYVVVIFAGIVLRHAATSNIPLLISCVTFTCLLPGGVCLGCYLSWGIAS